LHAPGRGAGADAGRPELLGGGGARWGSPGAGMPATGKSPGGRKHSDLRRFWRRRHSGRAVGQVLRRRRHGGVLREERRAWQITWSRPSHRPHAGRLHEHRPEVRCHLRRGRQVLISALQRRSQAGRVVL
jgi:hypothetical protein